jgi:hypothetical protein
MKYWQKLKNEEVEDFLVKEYKTKIWDSTRIYDSERISGATDKGMNTKAHDIGTEGNIP